MFLIFLDFPLTLNIKLQETHETIHIISRLKVKTRKDKGEGKGQDTSARARTGKYKEKELRNRTMATFRNPSVS